MFSPLWEVRTVKDSLLHHLHKEPPKTYVNFRSINCKAWTISWETVLILLMVDAYGSVIQCRYIFDLQPQFCGPKCLEFPELQRLTGMSCAKHKKSKEVTRSGPLDSFRRGLVAKGTNLVITGLELSAPSQPSSEEERAGDWTIQQWPWFNRLYLCNVASIKKLQTTELGELAGGWTHVGAKRVAFLEKAWKVLAHSFFSCPMHLLHLAVSKF